MCAYLLIWCIVCFSTHDRFLSYLLILTPPLLYASCRRTRNKTVATVFDYHDQSVGLSGHLRHGDDHVYDGRTTLLSRQTGMQDPWIEPQQRYEDKIRATSRAGMWERRMPPLAYIQIYAASTTGGCLPVR